MSKSPRSYNQFCALAKALDIVGERWTLLVVRELLSGPKRFKDLQDALPGIGPNLLSARLKDMESQGLVARAKLPPPAASAVYELTERGSGLGEVLQALVRWGFSLLATPRPDEIFLPRWAMQAMVAMFRPAEAEGISETYEFHVDGEIFHIRVDGGRAIGQLGPAARPDMVLAVTRDQLLGLGFGAHTPEHAAAQGWIRHGSAEAMARCQKLFGH